MTLFVRLFPYLLISGCKVTSGKYLQPKPNTCISCIEENYCCFVQKVSSKFNEGFIESQREIYPSLLHLKMPLSLTGIMMNHDSLH